MKQLETERLILRPFQEGDLERIYDILSHPDIWRHDPGRQRTFEETRSFVLFEDGAYRNIRFGQLAVVRREDTMVIGYCGLQLLLLDHGLFKSPEVEMFFALDRDLWGHGYITEAANAVIHYGFDELRLRRIVSTASVENRRSIRLMQRIGMHFISDPFEPEWVVGAIENPALKEEEPSELTLVASRA